MIRRWIFTGISFLSLLMCVLVMILWFHGRGRAEGWYFRPSAPFVIEPPAGVELRKDFWVQWQINWGNDGELVIARQVKSTKDMPPIRLGWFSVAMPVAKRWNPVPEARRPYVKPPAVRNLGNGTMLMSFQRTKPETHWQFLRMEHDATEQEFGQVGRRWVNSSGGRSLSVPLLWLFVVFAMLPVVRTWRAVRNVRRRRVGCCPACGYNLTGNTSGVCPECGNATGAAKAVVASSEPEAGPIA